MGWNGAKGWERKVGGLSAEIGAKATCPMLSYSREEFRGVQGF